jgi:hypothetical protein
MSGEENKEAFIPETVGDVPQSTNAMISLIAGILGLTAIPFIGSIIAIWTGRLAVVEIEESAGALTGTGMAQAGQVLGWIGVGLMVLTLCLAGLVILTSLVLMLFVFREAMGVVPPLVVACI